MYGSTRRSETTTIPRSATTRRSTWGERYYTFSKPDAGLAALLPNRVRFFALDTTALDDTQMAWLERELRKSDADWQICFFHHPLYSSGRYGWQWWIRRTLEPVLAKYKVDAVFSGHEHLYERLVPQLGVQYFISGGGGDVRKGDLRPSKLTVRGFDADLHFMLIEIAGDDLYYQAISRSGVTVDSGQLTRR